MGAPAGVTLIHDDAVLLVSSTDAATSSDQVLFLELATGKQAAATKVIGATRTPPVAPPGPTPHRSSPGPT